MVFPTETCLLTSDGLYTPAVPTSHAKYISIILFNYVDMYLNSNADTVNALLLFICKFAKCEFSHGEGSKFDRNVDPNIRPSIFRSTNLLQLSSFLDLKYTDIMSVLIVYFLNMKSWGAWCRMEYYTYIPGTIVIPWLSVVCWNIVQAYLNNKHICITFVQHRANVFIVQLLYKMFCVFRVLTLVVVV